MSLTADELVSRIDQLVSIPEVCLKVNELIDSPTASVRDVEKAIGQDPAMTTALLSLANSAFFGAGGRVETLSRAVIVVGMQNLRDLVWAISSMQSFSGLDAGSLDMKAYWKHSVYTGITAKVLAGKCRVIHKERLFVAGLLHDIGKLVMYQTIPETMEQIRAEAAATGTTAAVCERNHLGFDHGDVGAALMRHWQLPTALSAITMQHHKPWQSVEHRLDTSLVHMADGIAHQYGVEIEEGVSQDHIDPFAWNTTGLSEKIVDSVVQIAEEQYQAAMTIFAPVLAAA